MSSIKHWPLFECTRCNDVVLDAFGKQMCNKCRELTVTKSNATPSMDKNEIVDDVIWVVSISRDGNSVDDPSCDCASWGPWLHKTEKGASARLLSELTDIINAHAVLCNTQMTDIVRFFNSTVLTNGDCIFTFKPEYTSCISDITLTINALVNREFRVNVEWQSVNK